MSPTQRSVQKLKAEGWLVAIVEHWNPYAKVRQDLFGFIDILALCGDSLLAIQTTTGSNVSARIKKIQALQAAQLWLESNNRKIIVHGWTKMGPRGKRKLWTCHEHFITA